MQSEASVAIGLYAASVSKAGAAKAVEKKGGAAKSAKPKAASSAVAVPVVDKEEAARRFGIVRSVGEECVTEDDLRNLLSKKENFRLYDGFEPSGRMHIAQGIFKALNVNKCTSSGGTFCFWVADWFALMNDKMGGDLEKIKVVGEYFIEVWKGAGMDLSNVEFRWASEDIINNAKEYWNQMLDITKRFTIARIKKCCQIMGRLENKLTAAQVLYPLMQCTDVFFLRADICQLGVDQRKVNMLAREYCDCIGRKLKPVILSHHMLYGLAEGQAKMSKSNPDSAIFMEDTVEEVNRKIGISYCPRTASTKSKESSEESMSLVEDDLKNPCLDYVEHIVMSQPNAVFKAGNKSFTSFQPVKDAFLSGEISETELKTGLADCVNVLMQPVRDHFATDPHARKVLELVKQYKREDAKPPKSLKRMSKFPLGPSSYIVVFAPIPNTPEIALGELFSLKQSLRKAQELADSLGGGKKVALYMQDLSAIALNAFSGKKKLKAEDGIHAAFEVLVATLESVGALDDVQLIKQSDAMLKDPSDYWVSVINVGRHFQLQEIHDTVGNEEAQVGAIVAGLMHVGDILALAPHSIVVSDKHVQRHHELACKFIKSASSQQGAIEVPELVVFDPISLITSAVESTITTRLHVLDSFKAHVKKKIKQAFCEPGNVDYNPILTIVEAVVFTDAGEFKLERPADLGGDVVYKDLATLVSDYRQEKIHPGDLKKAVGPIMEKVYAKIDKALKSV
eukprot:CAMPEP_0203754360 /NCGR_PEP_ID=MMETSP0098-20131031/7959_1 /ASSEMBLY_ACC=CAM_ASM_000208 /TAXON_ID=96639 /ORGANISM=" , Strain NY0313808BC1" /LENGTH=736 /DNA_ID=CAMNT_0050645319 /DNA_START=214 /DNA_END=2420 /DNA_ORIENTATION=-